RSVEALVEGLDGFETLDRGAQVGDRLRALLRRQVEVEEPPHRAVLDEDGVGEAGKRQSRRTSEKSLARLHPGVEALELAFVQVLHVVRRRRLLANLPAPRQ